MSGGAASVTERPARAVSPSWCSSTRLLVTLVHLRLGLPHTALAKLFAVDRSTVSAAVREIRPPLAARGFATPDHPGLRIRTLDDLFAYANIEGVELRIDGTEVQVRRPRAGRPGRKVFISGKKKQNTIKITTFLHPEARSRYANGCVPDGENGDCRLTGSGNPQHHVKNPTYEG
ncbi:helix-turn-helix domain-containing protein [Streptomyces sp. NPDC002144]